MAPKMDSGNETPLPLMTSGAMHDGSKRRGDQLEQEDKAGDQAPLVVHYFESFDLKRLEHMVVSYQGSAVIASYPNRVQQVISPGARAMVQPKESFEAQHVPPDVRQVLLEDAIMRNDFEEFHRWQVV